jgi:putative ABC transport system permease protein
MGFDPADETDPAFRRAHWVRAFARLEPGVSQAEADAQLQVVVRRLQEEYPATNAVMGAGIMPMRDFLTQDARTFLGILLGAGAFLLLLACTNVANLLLVRASERAREVTLRRVLGASRPRVVRQMLMESAVLAAAGGVAGLALGWLVVRAVSATARLGIDGATAVSLDWRVALFTFGTAALSGLVCGTAPALRAGREGTDGRLSDGARGSTAGGVRLRTAAALVSVQVALALLLVAGAGLMARTFWHLLRVDPGFRAEGVLAVQFAVQAPRYAGRDDVLGFYDQFAESLEARPGVERVGTVGRLPLDGRSWSSQFTADGWPPERVGIEILHRRADRGYFEALDIPLLAGRMFGAGDRLAPQPPGAPPVGGVVLVNETFVREYFPGEDPIGRRITYDREPGPRSLWHEIVGIVGDQQQQSPARPALPEVFENRDQDWGRNNWVVVRGSGEAADLVEPVRSVLAELDPLIPLARVRPLEAVRAESVAGERSVLLLLSAFGSAALLLATVGIYGVTSRAARRRTQEIGIRMALGARGGDVERLMLARGLAAVVVGLSAGIVASLFATRALSSLLYGVEPADPVTLGAVVALLGSVALLACWIPVRRATAADPVAALRSE